MEENKIYESEEYEFKFVFSLYDFFKYCIEEEKNCDIRYLCFITNNQLIIGIDDNNNYFHYEISKAIQKTIFPTRNYFKTYHDEYNKAIRIYGYGFDSAYVEFPEYISINQYNYLLEILDDCIRANNDFNKGKFLSYYEKILEFAKKLISEIDTYEKDEIIISAKNKKEKVYKIM